MSKHAVSPFPSSLLRAGKRFTAWRRKQKRGSRLSEKLWAVATAQAHQHGISKTARALGLDYYSLKKHVESCIASSGDSLASSCDSSTVTPSFIEMPGWSHSDSECTFHFQDERGATMRIQLKGVRDLDLPACVSAFRSGHAVIGRSKKGGKA